MSNIRTKGWEGTLSHWLSKQQDHPTPWMAKISHYLLQDSYNICNCHKNKIVATKIKSSWTNLVPQSGKKRFGYWSSPDMSPASSTENTLNCSKRVWCVCCCYGFVWRPTIRRSVTHSTGLHLIKNSRHERKGCRHGALQQSQLKVCWQSESHMKYLWSKRPPVP